MRQIDRGGDPVPILINLAALYKATDHEEWAIQSYEQALHIAPDRSDLWKELGLLYGKQGRLQEAKYALALAMDLVMRTAVPSPP